jgi:hypothetical protein
MEQDLTGNEESQERMMQYIYICLQNVDTASASV